MSSIDERLDRLTERHEALTQTVELLMRQSVEYHERFELHEKRFEQIASTLESMLKLAQNHQQRIERLEKGDAA